MASALPNLKRTEDGRMHYSWTATLAGPLRVPLVELPEKLGLSAQDSFRSSLGTAGLEDPGDLEAEVAVSQVGERTYALEVTAPLQPHDWNMAAAIGVMQAFDALTGPVQEIDGRPRAVCPPWFFAAVGTPE